MNWRDQEPTTDFQDHIPVVLSRTANKKVIGRLSVSISQLKRTNTCVYAAKHFLCITN